MLDWAIWLFLRRLGDEGMAMKSVPERAEWLPLLVARESDLLAMCRVSGMESVVVKSVCASCDSWSALLRETWLRNCQK